MAKKKSQHPLLLPLLWKLLLQHLLLSQHPLLLLTLLPKLLPMPLLLLLPLLPPWLLLLTPQPTLPRLLLTLPPLLLPQPLLPPSKRLANPRRTTQGVEGIKKPTACSRFFYGRATETGAGWRVKGIT